MINVAAIRMKQFGVQFYQASLTAGDIDKLVRFEVLNYGQSGQPPVRGGKKKTPSKVNWDLLERRIASSEKAYQRHIIRKKIDELVQYYEQCRQARDLPSIPGAVIISCDEKLTFEAIEAGASVGRLKVPEREGILRAIDGQHRLLALHADLENIQGDEFTVPAIIFDRCPRTTSSRCSSRSTPSTRGSMHRTSSACRAASCTGTKLSPRHTTWSARSASARIRRSRARSSCSVWAAGGSPRRRWRRS
jgi:hypothetical protein